MISLGIRNFHQLLYFLVYQLHSKLLNVVDSFVTSMVTSKKPPHVVPFAQQLVGLRRLEWMADPLFRNHLSELSDAAEEAGLDDHFVTILFEGSK